MSQSKKKKINLSESNEQPQETHSLESDLKVSADRAPFETHQLPFDLEPLTMADLAAPSMPTPLQIVIVIGGKFFGELKADCPSVQAAAVLAQKVAAAATGGADAPTARPASKIILP